MCVRYMHISKAFTVALWLIACPNLFGFCAQYIFRILLASSPFEAMADAAAGQSLVPSGSVVSALVPSGSVPSGSFHRRSPKVEEGDYFKTRGPNSKLWCFGYSKPPCATWQGKKLLKLEKDAVFGPVHEVAVSQYFISVRAPMWYWGPETEDCSWHHGLVWVNVFHRRTKIHYAKKVRAEEIAMWKLNGWRDYWMDKASEWS